MPVRGAYSYSIAAERLPKPVGGVYNYIARVQYIYLVDGVKKHDVDNNFGKAWGRTSQEARQEMQEIVEHWIDQH